MPSHQRVERIGHRGAPRDCMENTVASFRRAVELGADAVELDVHVSSDGVPVVHHDPQLNAKVAPSSLAGAELAKLDSGQIKTIRLSSGDPIPTLIEVLHALTPTTRVYVEIKGGSPAAIANVLAPFRDSIAVHSFDHDCIVEMRRLDPAIRRGILIEKSGGALEAMVARTAATDVWPAYKLVDESFMDRAGECGVRVIPWTVNSEREVQRLVALGVAGICTNDLSLFSDQSG